MCHPETPLPEALRGVCYAPREREEANAMMKAHKACTPHACRPEGGVAMISMTSLLIAIERHDSAVLNTLLDQDGMTDERFTLEPEATPPAADARE